MQLCLEQVPPFSSRGRVGPTSIPACPMCVCAHPRFAYKDEYEKFKLYLTIILILISFTCRFLLNSRWVSYSSGQTLFSLAPAPTLCSLCRVTDAAFNFLLVWYYCTLTIRESILINNGSRWARA